MRHVSEQATTALRQVAAAMQAMGRNLVQALVTLVTAYERTGRQAAALGGEMEAFAKRLAPPPSSMLLPDPERTTGQVSVTNDTGVRLLRGGWPRWTPEQRAQALADLPPGAIRYWVR